MQLPSLSERPGPKYKALAAALQEAVRDGVLAPGSKLPPVRELAWQLSITPGTVARAYTILTDMGVCEATVGRGTFVKPDRPVDDASYVSSITNAQRAEDDVDLSSPALPDRGQSALIGRLLSEIALNPPSSVADYPTRESVRPARRAILQWLAGTPLGALDDADIVLSHGGQNGILLALQAILKGPRPVVLLEELSYPGFRHAAELLRAEPVPVAMDDDGIIPDAFEAAIRNHGAQVLCTSCEVHNPTAISTPEARRRALADIAQRHQVQIVEDDCYRMAPVRGPSYRLIAPERGWYVSSISKTLTPALRIGFVIAPPGQGARLRRAAEHGFFGLATPLADLTARLLGDPRSEQMLAEATDEIGRYVQMIVNHLGGYDVSWRLDVPIAWLRLPRGWRASAFCQAAAERGVKLRPAEDFTCRETRPPHAVRIAVNARIAPARFEAAMTVLRELLDNPPEQIGV